MTNPFPERAYAFWGSEEDAKVVFVSPRLIEALGRIYQDTPAMDGVLNGGLVVPIEWGGQRLDFRITLDEG